MRAIKRLCAVLCLLLLGGCFGPDSDQVRLCRMIMPALHAAPGEIAILQVVAGPSPDSVLIRYLRKPDEPGQSEHRILCAFGGGRLSRARQELTGLTFDRDRFGEARLLYLKRFWLNDPAAALAAPAFSAQELQHLPQFSRRIAVALQFIVAALPQIAIYALIAPSYALIYGLIGRINLAFGELAIIGGQGALIGSIAGTMLGGGDPYWVLAGGLCLALAAAATHGDLMARAVFVPLLNRSGQALLVASAGLAVAGMEYIRLAQGESNRWVPPLLNTPVMLARNEDFIVTATEGALLAAGLALVTAAALALFMRRSAFGRAWRAMAEEPAAAALFGVDIKAVLIRSFAIASLLAGFAGFIMTAHYGGIGFSGGLAIGLKALIGAVAGGIGSVGGAMLGAILIGSFEALWSAFFQLEHADIAVYSVLAILLILRPGGLFGWAEGSPRRV
jgi:branched-chain amino acid transport system permease protein